MARDLLLDAKHRPPTLPAFVEVVGFLSLNGDSHVAAKMKNKNMPHLSKKDRITLVQLACEDTPWLDYAPS